MVPPPSIMKRNKNMERIAVPARPDYLQRLAEAGCTFPTMYGKPYMAETLPQPAAYRLTAEEVEKIQTATRELHAISLAVVDHAVRHEEAMNMLRIPNGFADIVAESWLRGDQDLYQRLDVCFDRKSGEYKLFEFNGDTPTGVVEMNANLHWWEDAQELGMISKDTDVFNDFRFHMVNRMSDLKSRIGDKVFYFSSVKNNDEEEATVRFLKKCAEDADIFTEFLHLEDIRAAENDFIDKKSFRVEWLFKLFPWEDMAVGDLCEDIRRIKSCTFVEPAWKMVWSNKAFLALAWKLFPGHPNLLPAFVEGDPAANGLKNFIRKPQWGREGQNMSIVKDGQTVHSSDGAYGNDTMILQQYLPMPSYDGRYPVIGSWVVNNEPAGVLIREDSNPITGNLSACIPTFIQ